MITTNVNPPEMADYPCEGCGDGFYCPCIWWYAIPYKDILFL